MSNYPLMEKSVNIGLIGYGMSGEVFHAPIITSVPGLKLAAVVERSGSRSKERYPWVKIVPDVDGLLGDPQIEMVVISTPNTTHFDFARKALEAGKHVVVEKPVAVTSREAEELARISKSRNRILTVYQNRRLDGDFLTVRRVLEDGLLGDLVEFQSRYEKYAPRPKFNWRESDAPGSGIVYDLGSHLIDQALVLFGIPQSVEAEVGKRREGAVTDDFFEIRLGYPGVRVSLHASQLVREPGPRFALHGTKGSFVKHGMDPQEEWLKSGKTPRSKGWGIDPEKDWGILNTEIGDLHFRGKIETSRGRYEAFYENLYHAITEGKPLLVKPEEACETIRQIEKAMGPANELSRASARG